MDRVLVGSGISDGDCVESNVTELDRPVSLVGWGPEKEDGC